MIPFFEPIGYNEKIEHLQQRFTKNGQEYKKIYIPYGVAIAGGTNFGAYRFEPRFPTFFNERGGAS